MNTMQIYIDILNLKLIYNDINTKTYFFFILNFYFFSNSFLQFWTNLLLSYSLKCSEKYSKQFVKIEFG